MRPRYRRTTALYPVFEKTKYNCGKRERERMEKGIRKKEKRQGKRVKEKDREAINTIGIEYRKALEEKEKEEERNFRGTQKDRCDVDVFRAEPA